MNILKRYKKGEFRTSMQGWLPDGTVLLTLIDPSGVDAYLVRVKDLGKPSEKVIETKKVSVEDLMNVNENIDAIRGY